MKVIYYLVSYIVEHVRALDLFLQLDLLFLPLVILHYLEPLLLH